MRDAELSGRNASRLLLGSKSQNSRNLDKMEKMGKQLQNNYWSLFFEVESSESFSKFCQSEIYAEEEYRMPIRIPVVHKGCVDLNLESAPASNWLVVPVSTLAQAGDTEMSQI